MTVFDTVDLQIVDPSTCDREPIHVPGSIQPHGTLLVLSEPDFIVVQAALNATDFLGRDRIEDILGSSVYELFDEQQATVLENGLGDTSLEGNPVQIGVVSLVVSGHIRYFYAIAHRMRGVLILELEPTVSNETVTFQNLYSLVRDFVTNMQRVSRTDELNQLAADEVRGITGFDRVLIYQFDTDWNGTVIAESRNETLPSYLGLRFPAADIPAQARELYRLNRLRLIADAEYAPVPIVPATNPLTKRELDMTWCSLRSVSPVHIEYMRNMGTGSSMSISILREGRLWGLISCHSESAKLVSFEVRTACDFLAQVLSVQLAAKEHNAEYEYRIRLKSIQSRLLGFMAEEESFIDGLIKNPRQLMELASASAVAVVVEGEPVLLGDSPWREQVLQIVDWLTEHGQEDIFHTECLSKVISSFESHSEKASGLLAIAISKVHRSYILWFRPEVVQTVRWGGDPRKPVTAAHESTRLNPRKSFEMWKQTVRNTALPWRASEIESAVEFRNAIVGIVLRKAEELAQVSAELKRSNKELETFSYSVSHDLRAPFRHIVGYSELLREQAQSVLNEKCRRYIDTIVQSAQYAGTLVDNLLSFSQVGRSSLNITDVNSKMLVDEVVREIRMQVADRDIEWKISDLPPVRGDLLMLRLVWVNLISNAVKYTQGREQAIIEIGSERDDREHVFYIRDNGVGFDMQYVDKLFGVFQRLHKMEEYEGTGIGLANVRRIVERHRGRAWAEGVVGAGATFYFSLPNHS